MSIPLRIEYLYKQYLKIRQLVCAFIGSEIHEIWAQNYIQYLN